MFREHLPFYLSIGMTPDEYWNGDCTLTEAYREAYRLRQEQENRKLWLQGFYIYEALCDVSPLLHAFAKPGTTPHEYRTEPVALTKDEVKRREKRDEEQRYQAIIAQTNAWASEHNHRFIQ